MATVRNSSTIYHRIGLLKAVCFNFYRLPLDVVVCPCSDNLCHGVAMATVGNCSTVWSSPDDLVDAFKCYYCDKAEKVTDCSDEI